MSWPWWCMFSAPVKPHSLPLKKSTLTITASPSGNICTSVWSLKEHLNSHRPQHTQCCIVTNLIKTGLTVTEWQLGFQWLYITQQRTGTLTKEKWGQPPFDSTIIYLKKTLIKFSFSPAPPPPSGVIKSAGSSAALSHTVLERHPPSYYQVQPCDLKLWFCSNDNKGEPRADTPNSSFSAW